MIWPFDFWIWTSAPAPNVAPRTREIPQARLIQDPRGAELLSTPREALWLVPDRTAIIDP